MLLPYPATYADRIAIDYVEKKIYVDRKCAGEPLLLSWHSRNLRENKNYILIPVEIDEIALLRSKGMRATEEKDPDMIIRSQAIEIIRLAAAYGASDIHFMMRGTHSEIQIVVKGGLRVLTRKTHEEGDAITRAIYQGIAKTRDSSFNPLEFQNAQIAGEDLPTDANLSSVRLVRGPCYPQAQGGAFMTARLQYGAQQKAPRNDLPKLPLPRQPDGEFRLPKMGYRAEQIAKIRTLMDAPNGVVIFTGPTGSGKTTAMFEALQETARSKPHRRLVTVEDPVEYPMSWAVQMAVTGAKNDAETGAAFGERIRVALRMAPHTILLGELRGPDVAVAALEAAVTGHQVWTTMHVTDPFLFVERLELMDRERLDRRIFCDHKIVRGVVAQRLLPKLCPHCSVLLTEHPTDISPRIVNALKTWGDLNKVRILGAGCDKCGHDGTLGRFAVAEVVVTTAQLMRDFVEHGSEKARENYRATPDADLSMLESAIRYALAGYLDPRAVEDCVDLIEPNTHRRTSDRHEHT